MNSTHDIYDVLLLLSGGASICISFLAFAIGMRIGDRKKWLLLGAMGGLEGLYCIFLYFYFDAPDIQSSFFWSGGFCIFMPFMTYIYVALSHNILQNVPKWFQKFPAIALVGSILFAAFMASDIFFGSHIVFKELKVHPGSLHRKLMLFNAFGQGWFATVNTLYFVSAFLMIRDFVRGHRKTWPIVVGTLFYFIALSSDFNILFSLYDFYFIQHFGFLAMVIGFNYYFAGDYIRSVHELASAHAELSLYRERMIQDEKLKLMGKMSSFISHEINSPLNVILICSEMAGDKINDLKLVTNYLIKITLAGERINKIIKGLSGFARDDVMFSPESHNLRNLVAEAVEISRYRNTNVVIPIDIQVPNNIVLDCQLTQMIQCLVNLINNAIDAQQQHKSPWINIIARQNNNLVEISVIDAGETINMERAKIITRPFYTTKSHQNGTGLGLAIVSMLVDRHGGSFEIDSTAENACFKITLQSTLCV